MPEPDYDWQMELAQRDFESTMFGPDPDRDAFDSDRADLEDDGEWEDEE